jgi:sodium-coupled neutral amino acid transporter 11
MAATADASFPLEHGGGLSSSSSSKDEEAAAERDDEETASSVIGVTFSLMKTLVGTGMLALPSGLAAISDRASMLWPANAFMLVLGALSAYTFWILGRLAYATGGRTLSDTWTRVHRQQRHGMRSSTARVVSAANLVYCVGLCLAYSLVLGDSLSALLRSAVVVGGSSSSVPSSSSSSSWLISRHSVILAVTAAVLWPLCNLRSMKALEPFSVAGVLSSLFVTCFVAFRCPVLVPSSPYGSGGQFVSSLPPMLQPQFGTYSRLFSAAPVVMIALGCVAWMGHFSAPEFYHLLGGGRAPNEEAKLDDSPARSPRQQDNPQQLNKYKIVTVVGYSIVALLNALMLSCGFLTFGGRSQVSKKPCRGRLLVFLL